MSALLAGVASADVALPVCFDMTCFCLRGPAHARHRPLKLGAFACHGLLSFTNHRADEVRAQVAEVLGTSHVATMPSCSHTHSAPALEPHRKVDSAENVWTNLNESCRRMIARAISRTESPPMCEIGAVYVVICRLALAERWQCR